MTDPSPTDPVRIRKYPNRRFYDVTHSRHVTLQDLHHLVRDGRTICVTDSRSGEDITPLVLTQIILEHDPPKMAFFGSDILHQVIQANQQMLRAFVENYFGRALEAFRQSQSHFEEFLRQAGAATIPGLSTAANPLNWAQNWWSTRPASGAPREASSSESGPRESAAPADDARELRHTVDELRRQIDSLQERLGGAKRPARRRKRG